MEMKIRQIELEDTKELIELYHQLLPWEYLDFKNTNNLLIDILKEKNYFIFVVEVDKKIISTCTLVIIKNLTHGGHPFGILENVVTDKNYRGKGYGKNLLNWIIDYAKAMGCHKLMVQTRKKETYIVDFYKKCGFSQDTCKGFLLNLENKNE